MKVANMPPHSRTSDPITSYQAGDQMHLFGIADNHKARIMAVLKKQNGLDAKQIGFLCGLDNVQVCRRTHELRSSGALRNCINNPLGCGVCRPKKHETIPSCEHIATTRNGIRWFLME